MAGSAEHFGRLFSGMAEPAFPIQEGMRVIHALGYREVDDPYSWISTDDAYKRYLGTRPNPILSKQKFGLAFHLACPNAERCQRRHEGKSVRGFAGVKGPNSLRSVDPDQYWTRRANVR